MGTPGAFGVRCDSVDRLSYNHCDSYPSGLGAQLLTQVRGANLDDWREKARKLVGVDGASAAIPTEADIEQLKPFTDLSVSERKPTDWYCLFRKLQGDIPETLKLGRYLRAEEFLADSLFCEWVYVVNLDENQFEIYKGYQLDPHSSGRYATKEPSMRKEDGEVGTYYPVALYCTLSLQEVQGEAMLVEDTMNKLEVFEELEYDEIKFRAVDDGEI